MMRKQGSLSNIEEVHGNRLGQKMLVTLRERRSVSNRALCRARSMKKEKKE